MDCSPEFPGVGLWKRISREKEDFCECIRYSVVLGTE